MLPQSDALCESPPCVLQAIEALENFAASGSKWLLTTTYPHGVAPNRHIIISDYYPIDLQKPPFNMKDPDLIFSENSPETAPNEAAKFQMLYSGEKLRSMDFIAMRSAALELLEQQRAFTAPQSLE